MSTYADQIFHARKVNVIKRVVEREFNASMNKVNTALAVDRPHCLARNNNTLLDYGNRECPSLYEAEAIAFARCAYVARQPVRRCWACGRALHTLLERDNTQCRSCRRPREPNK